MVDTPDPFDPSTLTYEGKNWQITMLYPHDPAPFSYYDPIIDISERIKDELYDYLKDFLILDFPATPTSDNKVDLLVIYIFFFNPMYSTDPHLWRFLHPTEDIHSILSAVPFEDYDDFPYSFHA